MEGELKITGIGLAIAPCLIRDLRLAGILKLDIRRLKLSIVWPNIVALVRTGVIPKGLKQEFEKKSEEIWNEVGKKFNIPQMTLDAGVWYVGRNYCIENKAISVP